MSLLQEKMASQSTGIQQLLQAEKRAAEKVAEARKRKVYGILTAYLLKTLLLLFILDFSIHISSCPTAFAQKFSVRLLIHALQKY